MFRSIIYVLPCLLLLNCGGPESNATSPGTYDDIQVAGAMKNVMWKGELSGLIRLDTISQRQGLYGIGPMSYLTGEILIDDGVTYVSAVNDDSTMAVRRTDRVSAPFFVYGNVNEWREIPLPENVRNLQDLEALISELTEDEKRPFALKLMGKVKTATIHVQNLPKGSVVSSPQEAHRGQVNYSLANEQVRIIGFYSTEHQGIFTHHDTFLHLHLITEDKRQMGHLDELTFDRMVLFLPKG